MWYLIDRNDYPMSRVEVVLKSFSDVPEVWNNIRAYPTYGLGWEVWTEHPEVWERIINTVRTALD